MADSVPTFPRRARIVIDFANFWVAGTGGGAGRAADVRCHRDRRGLPAIPMSQVKGTLRETAERLAAAGATVTAKGKQVAIADAFVTLFGGREADAASAPGALRTSDDAALDPELAKDFLDAETGQADPDKVSALFVRHMTTAISEAGVADDMTLRTIEAVVPLPVAGIFEWIAPAPPDFDWVAVLDAVAAATPAFGKQKADGYGQALAGVTAVQDAGAPAAAPGSAGAGAASDPAASDAAAAAGGRTAEAWDVFLWPLQRATFSARSATEGAHASRKAPTGAALLGWCARHYGAFDDPFAVFHSGAVRFGDAVPWAGGAEVVPLPRSLNAPKGQEEAAKAGGRLARDLVRNGRPATDEDKEEAGSTQYEALGGVWMTADHRLLKPETGQRLRTATREGRAAEGQLFGLQHLEPGAEPFVARLEIAAGVTEDDRNRLLAALDGQVLHLGRARNTGWGGAYACRLRAAQDRADTLRAGTQGLVKVLALSDIAAIDAFGAPAPWIDPAELGLPGACFSPRDSVIALRRYAPWNAHLGGRDTERQVIEAGSVLAYRLAARLEAAVPARRTVGAWQEAGLGRVWLNPPFLSGWTLPEPPAGAAAAAPQAPRRAEAAAWLDKTRRDAIRTWAKARMPKAEARAEPAARSQTQEAQA